MRDHDGHLALAKFPHKQDDIDVVLWEGVALSLAVKAGIGVPEWRIETIGDKPVILIRRFDCAGGQRIPFLSAMSMLGVNDNEAHSYLELADVLRQYGAATKDDLAQLWRRIVFSVLISNTDDNLRNHGFLVRQPSRLAAVACLRPQPGARGHSPACTFNGYRHGRPNGLDRVGAGDGRVLRPETGRHEDHRPTGSARCRQLARGGREGWR